jgi:hypothetical protein
LMYHFRYLEKSKFVKKKFGPFLLCYVLFFPKGLIKLDLVFGVVEPDTVFKLSNSAILLFSFLTFVGRS